MTVAVAATIERRILVNYRVDPGVLAAVLPAPFRPQVVDGHGLAGICLIRLGALRPAGLPAAVGVTTENAAHRVAVCWDTAEGVANGVYIPRRDTSSALAVAAGGRAFPGWQHRARFAVDESAGCFRIDVASRDGQVTVKVVARRAEAVTAGSVFESVDAASCFFRCSPLGYAATPRAGVFDGVALAAEGWMVEPLELEEVRSSFFEDGTRFPPGSAVVDSAFLMAGLDSTWRAQPKLRTTVAA